MLRASRNVQSTPVISRGNAVIMSFDGIYIMSLIRIKQSALQDNLDADPRMISSGDSLMAEIRVFKK